MCESKSIRREEATHRTSPVAEFRLRLRGPLNIGGDESVIFHEISSACDPVGLVATTGVSSANAFSSQSRSPYQGSKTPVKGGSSGDSDG